MFSSSRSWRPFDLQDDLGSIRCVALVRDFGAAGGTVVVSRGMPDMDHVKAAARRGSYHYSILARSYDQFDRDWFIGTLNNWGWRRDPHAAPPWYAGDPWTPGRS